MRGHHWSGIRRSDEVDITPARSGASVGQMGDMAPRGPAKRGMKIVSGPAMK